MHKLNIKMGVTEARSNNSYFDFSHDILYLKTGTFAAQYLSYDDPGDGYVADWGKLEGAFKPLYNAVYAARVLSFIMPADHIIEDTYRRHTTLDKKLDNVNINLYSDQYDPVPYGLPPSVESMGIWDVTVSPVILKAPGRTMVTMYYSGATKIWFGDGSRSNRSFREDL